MGAPVINSELMISSFLREAKKKRDPKLWLEERHAEALCAVMAGDEFITSTTTEGGGSSAERGINAQTLLELYEAALQRLEAEESAEEGTGGGLSGAVRYADFSGNPCILG